jgi:hypothetical protein
MKDRVDFLLGWHPAVFVLDRHRDLGFEKLQLLFFSGIFVLVSQNPSHKSSKKTAPEEF